MATTDSDLHALLTDELTRVRELVEGFADVDAATAAYRVDPDANTVAWLLWHSARVEDDHLAGLSGREQVWTAGGWHDRFGLPFDAAAIGYGQDSDEVAAVTTPAVDLVAYQGAVHEAALAWVATVDGDELGRVVDDSWDPPVTVGVRLVSVLGDCLQHLGQAAYVRGLVERDAGEQPG